MKRFVIHFWLLLILCTLIGGQSTIVHAQEESTVTQLRLPLGTVFEMIIDHEIESPSYSWSFSRENVFLQAGIGKAFRVRLVQNGSYFLTSEVRNASGTEDYKKKFHILVSNEAPVVESSGPADSVLSSTVPMRDAKGRMILQGGIDVLQLIPKQDSTKAIVLDMNDGIDKDNDGKKTNDQDIGQTFFSTKRSALHIWLTQPTKSKVYTLSIEGEKGTESLALLTAGEAATIDNAEQVAALENEELAQNEFGSGTIKFYVQLEEKDYKNAPLLLHWKFGDGEQSMLDSPIHTYGKNGIYSVSVDILNLRTGEIVDTLVNIARINSIVPNPTVPDVPNTDIPAEEEEEKDSLFSLATVMKYILGLVGAAIFGFAIIMIIKLLKGKGGISGALEKAEEKLVKEKKEGDVLDQPAPMAIPETEVETEINNENIIDVPSETTEKPEEDVREQSPSQEPVVDASEAPGWLQGGIQQAAAEGQTMSTPPPEPLQDPVPPPEALPTDSPVSKPSVTQSAQTTESPAWLDESSADNAEPDAIAEDENVPAWLQPETAAPEAPVEDASPEAKTSVEPPASEVSVTEEEAPAWLQEGLTQAATEGQTSSSPAPAELQDTPATEVKMTASAPRDDDGSIPQDIWDNMSPEEKELEKKRQKRKRYRQNKKTRIREDRAATSKTKEADETVVGTPIPEGASETAPKTTDTTAPAPAVEPQAVSEADDSEVKFVVGADSINDQTSGDIPLEESDNGKA